MTPPIPSLEDVKKTIGDRVEEWTEDQLIAALAYVDALAEREPPMPERRHRRHRYSCAWLGAKKTKQQTKGVLCTCDPERPR